MSIHVSEFQGNRPRQLRRYNVANLSEEKSIISSETYRTAAAKRSKTYITVSLHSCEPPKMQIRTTRVGYMGFQRQRRCLR